MRTYQVPNITTGAYWDSFGKGDSVTKLDQMKVDTEHPIDTFKIFKGN